MSPEGGTTVAVRDTDAGIPESPWDNSGSGAAIMREDHPAVVETGSSDAAGILQSAGEIIPGLRFHPDIVTSLQEVCRKYGLFELTLATDDGLVIATSAGRDVEFDAVHYSQVVQLMTTPSEPDVSLFELNYKASNLIGIIRANRHIHPILREKIRDDTKVILQWWL